MRKNFLWLLITFSILYFTVTSIRSYYLEQHSEFHKSFYRCINKCNNLTKIGRFDSAEMYLDSANLYYRLFYNKK